jgi:hypothetical protein
MMKTATVGAAARGVQPVSLPTEIDFKPAAIGHGSGEGGRFGGKRE